MDAKITGESVCLLMWNEGTKA